MNPIPDMLTVAETARRLRRSPASVRRLIHSGRLRAVRLSERGHLLVYADSLCALLGVRRERQHSREYHLKRDDEILARRGLL
ncbi:MAG: helix-turn-helix domain-containing protein [Phycisphaerae bacterium]|nr:helix-turn-helix domain-containing protein [Phycisphaerae bacterium]